MTPVVVLAMISWVQAQIPFDYDIVGGPFAPTRESLAGVPYDTVDPRFEGLYGQRSPDRMRRLLPEFGLNWYRRTKELVDQYDPGMSALASGRAGPACHASQGTGGRLCLCVEG